MKHRENSGPKSAENLHLIVSVNEATTTVSRNEINTVRQLDASVGLSNVTSSSADVCKKRKLEESTDGFEKNQVDIESLPQTNEWADTDQQFCSENTFIDDMNTVTEFADCILFENTLKTFDEPDELMAHEQTESSHLSNTMGHSVKKDFMSDIEVPGKYPQCENESIQKESKRLQNANINWTKTDINWAADYKLPTLDSQFKDAPLTVNKCLEESIGNLWFSKAEPAAVKLHKIIANGDLPKDHILFKLLSNIVSFVDLMSSGNRAEIKKWAWDEDVKGFIQSVRKVGGKKTLRLLRGPGNFGKGSRWKEFDIRNFKISHYQACQRCTELGRDTLPGQELYCLFCVLLSNWPRMNLNALLKITMSCYQLLLQEESMDLV